MIIKQMMEQNKANNIEQEIDMKTIIFHGKMRQGKTINAIHLALDQRYNGRIYSNTQIYKKGQSLLTKYIKDYDEIDKIRFSFKHGIIVIDEAGINASSRKSMSDVNMLLSKILFLAGKKNCSVIWIAQRLKSIDINARELADLIVQCKKIRREGKTPEFMLIKQRQKGEKLEQLQTYKLDTIGELKKYGITYNTLEESVLVNKINEKRKKDFKEKERKEERKRRQKEKKEEKKLKLKTKKLKNGNTSRNKSNKKT